MEEVNPGADRTGQIDRRRFVFMLSAMAGLPPAGLMPYEGAVQNNSPNPLEADELRALGAMCDQIFPKDDYPGAVELGIIDFLVKTLWSAHPAWKETYRAGLRAVRASSLALLGKPLEELDFERQTQFLKRMEEGKTAGSDWGSISSREFFWMIRDHTLQAMYSHPRYGGNNGKTVWKMIGYDDWWS